MDVFNYNKTFGFHVGADSSREIRWSDKLISRQDAAPTDGFTCFSDSNPKVVIITEVQAGLSGIDWLEFPELKDKKEGRPTDD